MANTKHHFNWKKLEEKPENWETLRQLIAVCNRPDPVYAEETKTDTNWTETYYQIFKTKIIQTYGKDTGECFPTETSKKATPALQKTEAKKQQKKNPSSIKNKIRQETERNMIDRDLNLIRFDPKSIKPICTSFKLQPTFDFMIAEWCIILWKKTHVLKQSVSHYILTDALISLDRVLEEDIMVNKDVIHPDIVAFFQYLNTKIQPILLRDDFYKQIFLHHPELMVNPFSQKRAGRVGFYPEQVKVLQQVVDSVVNNTSLLLGDRMPPGTGKTFLAVPLAQKLAAMHSKKTLLFACHNNLVRMDVATLALLGKNIHLWMGVYDAVDDEFLIRPHKSCFPVTWKKVYKTNDENKSGTVFQQCQFYKQATGQFPDLLVADLPTCLALLKDERLNGQFIAYIDEFVSEPDANAIMVDVARFLPKQTVLLSAILPRFEDIPSLVNHFKTRYPECQVVRIESNHLTISCTVVDPDGNVALPHHFISNEEEIPQLIQKIREDPLIGRMYAPQQVYSMVEHIQSFLPKESGLSFDERFASIGKIDHAGIRAYVLDLLAYAETHPPLFSKMKEYRPMIMNAPDIHLLATEHSHYYNGKTLVITSPEVLYPTLEEIKSRLLEEAPDLTDMIRSIEKTKALLQRELELAMDASSRSKQKIDPVEHQMNISRIRDDLQKCFQSQWPEQFVVNSPAHAKKYNHQLFKHAIAPNLSHEYDTAFSGFLHSLLLSGIGVYDFSQCTEHQRRLTMKALKYLSFLFAGKEIVFGTNIEGLTHMFIDKSFGDNATRNVLYQLIGRAGRMGQSYQAYIVVNGEKTLSTMMSFVSQTDEDALFFQKHF